MRLSDFAVLSFDCYGTLIDWESGIWTALQPLLAKTAGGVERETALAAFGREESAQEAGHPGLLYSELLARVHAALARRWGVTTSAAEDQAFGASIGDWPAFPDTAAALLYLSGFYQLAVLSNVDRASFARTQPKLDVAIDILCTAEDVGSYKPELANFRFLLDRAQNAGFAPGQLLHVAQSLYHDHAPANRIGLHSAWIDRRQGQGGGATPEAAADVHYDFRFTSLAALAEAHRAEQ